METVHMSEAEVARDLHAVLASPDFSQTFDPK
jgi:hypothetical protein